MCTWEEIGHKWHRAQQMGWQAIQAAMDVGDDLAEKKQEWKLSGEPMMEFYRRADNEGISQPRVTELTRIALHRELIEEHKPDSMRGALALLPKVPTKTSEKQIDKYKEEVNQYDAFAKETAKKQAQILAKKMIKAELAKLQNQAHDAVTAEMKALRRELKKERDRVGVLMEEADQQKTFYIDLINKKLNGFDVKAGIKLLKQAVHPDRVASVEIRNKAMDIVQKLDRFFS